MEEKSDNDNQDCLKYNNIKANLSEITEIKIILLGDSSSGKTKLLQRFLENKYHPQLNSTYALKYTTEVDDLSIVVDIWDTAGQERFFSLHPSYYHNAHACIMVFDATRKITYKNLTRWYEELRSYRPSIPVMCAANKIDVAPDVTSKSFAFPSKHDIPLYYVSAADGSNVVKLFRDAISAGLEYKKNPTDWTDQLLAELDEVTNATNGTNSNTPTITPPTLTPQNPGEILTQ